MPAPCPVWLKACGARGHRGSPRAAPRGPGGSGEEPRGDAAGSRRPCAASPAAGARWRGWLGPGAGCFCGGAGIFWFFFFFKHLLKASPGTPSPRSRAASWLRSRVCAGGRTTVRGAPPPPPPAPGGEGARRIRGPPRTPGRARRPPFPTAGAVGSSAPPEPARPRLLLRGFSRGVPVRLPRPPAPRLLPPPLRPSPRARLRAGHGPPREDVLRGVGGDPRMPRKNRPVGLPGQGERHPVSSAAFRLSPSRRLPAAAPAPLRRGLRTANSAPRRCPGGRSRGRRGGGRQAGGTRPFAILSRSLIDPLSFPHDRFPTLGRHRPPRRRRERRASMRRGAEEGAAGWAPPGGFSPCPPDPPPRHACRAPGRRRRLPLPPAAARAAGGEAGARGGGGCPPAAARRRRPPLPPTPPRSSPKRSGFSMRWRRRYPRLAARRLSPLSPPPPPPFQSFAGKHSR